MTKKLNYYQVHRNKKPKRLPRHKFSFLKLQTGIIALKSFSQQAIIVSQSFNTVAEKSKQIVENLVKTAEAITDLHKKHRYQKQFQNQKV